MKQQFFILFLILFLYGCPVCNIPTTIVDVGPISDSLYNLVPYQDSLVYKFVHSNGYVVSFHTRRKTNQVSPFFDQCSCSEVRKYYSNTTTMFSDYPAITIQLDIVHFDSITSVLNISVQNNYFQNENFIKKAYSTFKSDSLLINHKYYTNVFVFKNQDMYNNQIMFADSLYYTRNNGIVKIFMTNGDSYSIYN